jgi:hypothetical protein
MAPPESWSHPLGGCGNQPLGIPSKGKARHAGADTAWYKQLHRLRAHIDPMISHCKVVHRMGRCWISGLAGDQIRMSCTVLVWNTKQRAACFRSTSVLSRCAKLTMGVSPLTKDASRSPATNTGIAQHHQLSSCGASSRYRRWSGTYLLIPSIARERASRAAGRFTGKGTTASR